MSLSSSREPKEGRGGGEGEEDERKRVEGEKLMMPSGLLTTVRWWSPVVFHILRWCFVIF